MTLALAVLAALCGCDPCEGLVPGPCAAPLSLAVHDARTGLVLEEATAVGVDADRMCSEGRCTLSPRRVEAAPWRYQITVAAPGYVTREVTGTVERDDTEGCFPCSYVPVDLEVSLDPES